MRIPARRWALAALAATVIALLASALLAAPRASAETAPEASAAELSAGAAFEITPEGIERLQQLIAVRWLPSHARLTLAAMLERAGVDHERLVGLLQRGSKHVEACERAAEAGEDVGERCRGKLERGDGTQLCERVLAATEADENLVERCRAFLDGKGVDWRQLCERVAAAGEAPERLIERCRALQQRLAAAAATPSAEQIERRAALHEAMSAFWACVRDEAAQQNGDDGHLEGVRADCAAKVTAEFGVALDLGLPAFKASPEGEKRGLRGVRLDGTKATSELRAGANHKQNGNHD